MDTRIPYARTAKSNVSTEQGVPQDSVLARYIKRFRNDQPKSREERRQMASAVGEETLPFWWTSPSSLPPTSTPTKTTHKDDHRPAIFSPAELCQLDRTPSPCRGPYSMLSDSSPSEFEDTEILHLQERAGRLLQRGDFRVSDGSIPVSSEGLGCSDFSSPVSVDEPLRRCLIPSLIKSTSVKTRSDSTQAKSSQISDVIPSMVPPSRREEDILFQWRLRRKMEQARESQSQHHSGLHASTFSWQGPSVHHPSANGQAYEQPQVIQPPEPLRRASHSHITSSQPETKEVQRACPPASSPHTVPGSSVSQHQSLAHVPAHMHLLCDVLPCPIQPSHASPLTSISQRQDESSTKVLPKKTQVPGNSNDAFTDEPALKHITFPTPAPPGHNKRTERDQKKEAQTKNLEKNEKKAAKSIRKQKKLARCTVGSDHADGLSSANMRSAHQRVPKKDMSWKSQQQHQRFQDLSSKSSTGNPPSSPIHSTLGQVVSEVLFPTVESCPAQRAADSSAGSPCTVSAPPQSSLSLCNTQDSIEVISQLLQEAEDSDEKEFEDDPLLQVLRKQRKWVKDQIREVYFMLVSFLDEQQVTTATNTS